MDWSLFDRFQQVVTREIGPRVLPALAETMTTYLSASGCCIIQERDEQTAIPLLNYPNPVLASPFEVSTLTGLISDEEFFLKTPLNVHPSLQTLLGNYKQVAGLRLSNYSLKGWILVGWHTPVDLSHVPLQQSFQLMADKVMVNFLSLQRIALEQQYRFLFATVPQAIVRINEDDNSTWANQAATELLQLDPDNVFPTADEVLAGMQRLRDEAINQDVMGAHLTELAQNPNANISNWVWAYPDRAFSVISRPIRSPYLNGRIWLFSDVSELYRSNRQLADQQGQLLFKNDQLVNANREIESLISVIAHDLKSPLATLSFVLNFISSEGTLNEQQQENVQYGQKTVGKGMDLIESIVYYNRLISREETLQLMEVELNDLLEIVVDGFRGPAQHKHINLSFRPQVSTLLRTDPESLVRVLDNLVSNALKFSEFDKAVWVSVVTEADRLVVSVHDQGPGILPEDRPKLFKRFQRLSAQPTNNEHSSGLGLSIVKALTEKMGATVELDSEPDRGTTFRLVFPPDLFQLLPESVSTNAN
ncbi:MAG: sensor histidine kinase [Cytophagales bacterium]|nr:MAG: sensor histidine kinase [Cytophagales bacterium]